MKLLFCIFSIALLSCNLNRSPIPNVILIAVDQLGFNQINCSREAHPNLHSGMELLCQESVRFTHAYTTSPLAAPALTSVLTGQYPLTHGLRHNADHFLSSRVETTAELALRQGLATGFFSGGAPILRKLNIQQGFENFDDNLFPSATKIFRPFDRSVKLFENWRRDLGRQSFFAGFYVPDLLFPLTLTQTDFGENRNLTFESQLEEFDESLYGLISALKAAQIWDNTMVILVGLNSHQQQIRPDELRHLSLSSDATQVGLLIKPAQKPRDRGMNWSYDDNVSLADVGATLSSLMDPSWVSKDADFPSRPLTSVLQGASLSPASSRPLLIESAWAQQEEKAPIRYAIRFDQLLFVLDEKIQIFNSLIDRSETTPVRPTENYVREPLETILRISGNRGLSPWPALSREIFLKWTGLSGVRSPPQQDAPQNLSFERIAYRLREDPEVSHLFTRDLLERQQWDELKRWAQGMSYKDLELIAKKNLRQPTNWQEFDDGCLKTLGLNQALMSDLKTCDDPLALSHIDWVLLDRQEAEESRRETAKKRFLRQFALMRLDHKIDELNWSLQGIWDLPLELRGETPVAELMLSLPETQKYRQQALRALQTPSEL